jgi:hypothetical protein
VQEEAALANANVTFINGSDLRKRHVARGVADGDFRASDVRVSRFAGADFGCRPPAGARDLMLFIDISGLAEFCQIP